MFSISGFTSEVSRRRTPSDSITKYHFSFNGNGTQLLFFNVIFIYLFTMNPVNLKHYSMHRPKYNSIISNRPTVEKA